MTVRHARPAPPNAKRAASHFERVRKLCLSFDDVEERLSHGEPTFFVLNRVFVMYAESHHGDLRYGLWCNVPEGAQEILLGSDPENFFFPPYVGKSGWVGMRLDRTVKWPTVRSIVTDSYNFTRARVSRRRARSRRG
ncbi:MAG TPA: MmcQ/YjbR family DNA-binding protein [Thermoanaerobaculia bacterium]|nr:MmcQ/YjbR family DNA-binding protein [Thermoanaerobaculia bacterium]